jgi:hypothetical protein
VFSPVIGDCFILLVAGMDLFLTSDMPRTCDRWLICSSRCQCVFTCYRLRIYFIDGWFVINFQRVSCLAGLVISG